LHVLERPSKGDPVSFLERIGGARAHQQGRAQPAEIDAGGLGQPPRFDQAHGIDPEQQVVHGLADLAVADLAEMGIVGAKAAVDPPSALDHVCLAANAREQRPAIRGRAPSAARTRPAQSGGSRTATSRACARSSSALTVSGLAGEDTAMTEPEARSASNPSVPSTT